MSRIDVSRLKEEIKSLSGQLKFLKTRVRDPELNKAVYCYYNKPNGMDEDIQKLKAEFFSASDKRFVSRNRITRLCILRALLRGRLHIPGTKDGLWKMVEREREAFCADR
jgi:hypothetical protein